MLSAELLRKVHLIEITTRKRVDDLMSGQFRTRFRGHGMQFSEHRQYVDGDDIRHIDWKVSARTRDPMLKKYEEERELTVFLVVDVSASSSFGSSVKLKSEMAAEISAMVAYAASHTGDKVGILLFAGEIVKIIPPKKGRQHILRVIGEILSRGVERQKPGTDLAGALEATDRVMKHKGVVFVVSDFIASGYEKQMKRLARKHDVVAVMIGDEREREVPSVGQLLLLDPESGQERVVDTSSYAFKRWFEEARAERDRESQEAFKSGRVGRLEVSTREDYAEAVVRFFRTRGGRR